MQLQNIEPRLKLKELTNEQLITKLAELMQATAQSLLRQAYIVVELESRGYDLDELKISYVHLLRRIGRHQLSSEAVANLLSARTPLQLLHRIGMLPMPEQERIATGDTIKLYFKIANGYDHRNVLPARMSSDEIKQAFCRDHLATEEEQIHYLEHKSKAKITTRKERVGAMEIDWERKGVTIKSARGSFISLSDLRSVVRALAKA